MAQDHSNTQIPARPGTAHRNQEFDLFPALSAQNMVPQNKAGIALVEVMYRTMRNAEEFMGLPLTPEWLQRHADACIGTRPINILESGLTVHLPVYEKGTWQAAEAATLYLLQPKENLYKLGLGLHQKLTVFLSEPEQQAWDLWVRQCHLSLLPPFVMKQIRKDYPDTIHSPKWEEIATKYLAVAREMEYITQEWDRQFEEKARTMTEWQRCMFEHLLMEKSGEIMRAFLGWFIGDWVPKREFELLWIAEADWIVRIPRLDLKGYRAMRAKASALSRDPFYGGDGVLTKK